MAEPAIPEADAEIAAPGEEYESPPRQGMTAPPQTAEGNSWQKMNNNHVITDSAILCYWEIILTYRVRIY